MPVSTGLPGSASIRHRKSCRGKRNLVAGACNLAAAYRQHDARTGRGDSLPKHREAWYHKTKELNMTRQLIPNRPHALLAATMTLGAAAAQATSGYTVTKDQEALVFQGMSAAEMQRALSRRKPKSSSAMNRARPSPTTSPAPTRGSSTSTSAPMARSRQSANAWANPSATTVAMVATADRTSANAWATGGPSPRPAGTAAGRGRPCATMTY